MSRTAGCLFALGLGLSFAAACGDDDGDVTNTGGTGGTAGSAGRGGTGGTAGSAGTGGTGGSDEVPDAGSDAAVATDAGGGNPVACPADLDVATEDADSSTVAQEVIFARIAFEGNDIRVTFRALSTGFNFAEPLLLCTGAEDSDCESGVADITGSDNSDGGVGNLLPDEEEVFLFEDAFVGTDSTPASGELVLINDLPSSATPIIRAYVNWGNYTSVAPTVGANEDLEAQAVAESVWTLGETIEVDGNTLIFATGNVISAEGFDVCTPDG